MSAYRYLLILVLSLGAAALARAQEPSQDSAEFPADFVVGRWIDGLGTQAALNGIHTLGIDETVQDGRHGQPIPKRVTIASQGRFRIESKYKSGRTLVQGYDGTNAWTQSDQFGFGLIAPQDLRSIVFRESPILPVLFSHHYATAHVLNEDVVQGKPCHVYAMSAQNAPDEVWTAEAATGLVRTIRAAGPNGEILISFNDYRPVESLTLPFETRIDVGDSHIIVRRQAITVNVPAYTTFFTASPWDLRDAQTVQTVLSNYVKHAESVESMQNVHSRIVKSTITTPATGVTSHKEVTILFPNKVLIDTNTTGMGDEVEGFNGTTGWETSDLEGFRLLKPTEIPPLFANLSTQADRSIAEEAPLRKIEGERIVDGRKTTAIALSTLSGTIGIFYFDEENGRLLRVGSPKQNSTTGVPESTIDYSDFRKVDGVETAFVTTVTTSTLQIITTIESIQNNVALDEDVFDPPSQD